MVSTASTMMPLGTEAPDFDLPDVNPNTPHETVSLDTFGDAPAYVMMFICNHCPYVKHIRDTLADVTSELVNDGVAVIGITSNDADNYPDDSPEATAEECKAMGYRFPYLFDEDQSVAKAYKAACTPDLFVFDGERKLVYRGQFDGSRPGSGVPVTGEDLVQAVRSVLAGEPVPEDQQPSMGCNIKWKPGNEPDYFG